MTVSCSNCGEEWPRDPALEVECPTCHAPVGVKCRRPSGHPCELHASREQGGDGRRILAAMPEGTERPASHGAAV